MIQKETKLVDEYLSSVEGVHEAEAPSFFYTRLIARMQGRSEWNFPLRPSFLIASLSILLAINTAVVINHQKSTSTENVNSYAGSSSIILSNY